MHTLAKLHQTVYVQCGVMYLLLELKFNLIVCTADSFSTDESRTPSLPTAMSNMAGPPSHCPSKRKYGEEQMDDRINCDDDHMTKMSRLFATQL